MSDYSKQLEEIARALSRPTTPVWLVATFSAVLGVLGGLTGQLLMDVAYRRYKLRRVLYLDLTEMFWAVHGIMAFKDIPEPERSRWQQDGLRRNLLFRGEKYCSDNQEIYIQLPERLAGETLYPRFHLILDEANSMHVNTSLALTLFADVVHRGSLAPKYFKRFLGRKRATSLLKTLDELHTRHEEAKRRMGLPSSHDA